MPQVLGAGLRRCLITLAVALLVVACGNTKTDLSGSGTSNPDSGADASECPAAQTQCGGSCTDTSLDPNNCGGCGTKCAAGEVCSGGTCSTTCGSGTTKCGGGDAGAVYCANL